MVPEGGAAWLRDRELLWSKVEALELRKDAQLAREFNMALPHELNHGQRLELVRGFVAAHFVGRGMVADIALHDPVAEHGQSARNFHAHVMLTLRRATARGLDPVKTREWNSRDVLRLWRVEWESACNGALERAGQKVRLDHRTLVAQRGEALARRDYGRAMALDRDPEIHVGPRARQVVRNGRLPVSRVRDVNTYRQHLGVKPAQRRQRVYTVYDRGSRQQWLERVLVGNNEGFRQKLKVAERRYDRLSRKFDDHRRHEACLLKVKTESKGVYLDRRTTARDENRSHWKIQHARKLSRHFAKIVKYLEFAIRLNRIEYQRGLLRLRELESWVIMTKRTRHIERMLRSYLLFKK
ncbi:MobA/MobL family protein [Rhizobium sp. PP-CC-3G-465]|nr:MobA/MobL family protein [Rhizobium sp. PP-CC-3G-465]